MFCTGPFYFSSTLIFVIRIGGFAVYDFICNLADVFFGKVYVIKFVRPMVRNWDFIDFIKVLINPAF